MILRLSGADFSANNIGTIQLTRELTAETIALLSNYTRTLSEAQKFAVQDFLDGLKVEGIWAHIENLIIPALAGDVSEAFYPIKGNGVYNTYTTAYELKNNGLYVAINDTSKTPAKIRANGSYMNLHIASYLTYCPENTAENTINSMYNGGSITVRERWVCNGTSKNIRLYEGTESRTISVSAKEMFDTPNFLGISSGTDDLYAVHNSSKHTYGSVFEDDTTITKVPFFVGADINNSTSSNIAQGLISTGSAMNSAMMLKYSELVDILMTSLLVS